MKLLILYTFQVFQSIVVALCNILKSLEQIFCIIDE